jgi:hypothetical protein
MIVTDYTIWWAAAFGEALAQTAAMIIADLIWRRASVQGAYFTRPTTKTFADPSTRWAIATANTLCIAFTGTIIETLPSA